MSLYRVAIVGRPNVGKSSLLNRLVGRRVAIVEPTAGVTRDRVAVRVEHGDRAFELVDTGGLGLVDEERLKDHIESQIQVALESADLVLFLVDSKEGRVPGDDLVAQRLRRVKRPVQLVVNKVESAWEEVTVHDWLRLGFGEPHPISAQEGYGCTDLLEKVVAALPEPISGGSEEEEAPDLKFAVVGKRNSGKSTLINALAREDRVIVSEIPGTTRDAVDVVFERDGRRWMAIDTAGARRRHSLQDAIEFYSYSRATASIRRADVVVHMFDITAQISQVDKMIAAYCVEHHKPVVLVGNKLDLAMERSVVPGRNGEEPFVAEDWDSYIRQQLKGLTHAPVLFGSARDGLNIDEMFTLMDELREQARTKIPTSRLNDVLQAAKDKLRPRSRGLMPKLFYGTQVSTEPVGLLLFVNEPKLFRGEWERYLKNILRREFALEEVPIHIMFRRREKVQLDPE